LGAGLCKAHSHLRGSQPPGSGLHDGRLGALLRNLFTFLRRFRILSFIFFTYFSAFPTILLILWIPFPFPSTTSYPFPHLFHYEDAAQKPPLTKFGLSLTECPGFVPNASSGLAGNLPGPTCGPALTRSIPFAHQHSTGDFDK
jgi:hypothetical protein